MNILLLNKEVVSKESIKVTETIPQEYHFSCEGMGRIDKNGKLGCMGFVMKTGYYYCTGSRFEIDSKCELKGYCLETSSCIFLGYNERIFKIPIESVYEAIRKYSSFKYLPIGFNNELN